MQLAIGKTYFYHELTKDKQINDFYIVYPRFYDNKKLLLSSRGIGGYLLKLWQLKKVIEYAVYPDNIHYLLTVPKNITYIYVIHRLEEDSKAYFELKKELNLIVGYASGEKWRNYSLKEFLETFSKERKWYLGISTKWELKEAVYSKFDYGDITTMALGSFKDLRSYERVKELLIKFFEHKNSLERQTYLADFS